MNFLKKALDAKPPYQYSLEELLLDLTDRPHISTESVDDQKATDHLTLTAYQKDNTVSVEGFWSNMSIKLSEMFNTDSKIHQQLMETNDAVANKIKELQRRYTEVKKLKDNPPPIKLSADAVRSISVENHPCVVYTDLEKEVNRIIGLAELFISGLIPDHKKWLKILQAGCKELIAYPDKGNQLVHEFFMALDTHEFDKICNKNKSQYPNGKVYDKTSEQYFGGYFMRLDPTEHTFNGKKYNTRQFISSTCAYHFNDIKDASLPGYDKETIGKMLDLVTKLDKALDDLYTACNSQLVNEAISLHNALKLLVRAYPDADNTPNEVNTYLAFAFMEYESYNRSVKELGKVMGRVCSVILILCQKSLARME